MEHMILAPAIRELLEKQYERLGIENNFIFGKVMQDKNLCISMLECLTGNHIDDIKEITIEKQFKTCSDSKGVRYDVFVEDDSERIYDAEMQNLNIATKKELPLRCRYYQGMIDLISLEQGMSYDNLKESYIIFICTSDPFNHNLGCYTICNSCRENIDIPFNDKRTILFYNAKGIMDDIPNDAKNFLNYINTGTVNGHFTKQLDDAVKQARQNKEWRVEYMHSAVQYWDVYKKGKREGLEEGKREGLEEGKLDTLITLVNEGVITSDIAASKTNMSVEDFKKIMKEKDGQN